MQIHARRREASEVVVLGSGLTGLAAASQLGDRAIVLEKNDSPGGLVRTLRLGGWHFDLVVHQLYIPDPPTLRAVRALMGKTLQPSYPEAFVETLDGTTRYPFQLHLGDLPAAAMRRCFLDFSRINGTVGHQAPENFSQWLAHTFGASMCEAFFYPYNRKMWKRPLSELAPSGFQWTITPPDAEAVRRGAETPDHPFKAYNSRGWYPRPGAEPPVRGMRVLADRLAREVRNLRLGRQITAIDTRARQVLSKGPHGEEVFDYRHACLSTLPLPNCIQLCTAVPKALLKRVSKVCHNRVVMIYLALRGPRLGGRGQWRYYADEGIVFNRLIYMHAFDDLTAPTDGWGLMAEITERGEAPVPDLMAMTERVVADAHRVGALGAADELVAATTRIVDPAYVAFRLEDFDVIAEARAFLRANGVTPLGRFGHWEYSGMAGVMRDGFEWGGARAAELGQAPPSRIAWAEA